MAIVELVEKKSGLRL